MGISPETLRRTNLGSLAQGSRVNLERAVSASTRMGGHFVQGHVDTIATILSVTPDGNALTFRLAPRDRAVLRYVVEKGYVTLDGASLTITAVDDGAGWWEVMLIAYTQERVVMGKKQAGEEVNVEVDMVAKYVEKSVRGYFEGEGDGREVEILKKMVERMVEETMARRNVVTVSVPTDMLICPGKLTYQGQLMYRRFYDSSNRIELVNSTDEQVLRMPIKHFYEVSNRSRCSRSHLL